MKKLCNDIFEKYGLCLELNRQLKESIRKGRAFLSVSIDLKKKIIVLMEELHDLQYQYSLRREIAEQKGYRYVGAFHEGIAVACEDDSQYFYIDSTGNKIGDKKFTAEGRSSKFNDGVGITGAHITRGKYIIDKEGNIVFGEHSTLTQIRNFKGGWAAVKGSADWYYINREFTLILKPHLLAPKGRLLGIGDFENHRAIVRIEENGQELSFFIDEKCKKVKLPGLDEVMFSRIGEFHDDVAVLKTIDNKYLIYNRVTAQATPVRLNYLIFSIGDLHDGAAAMSVETSDWSSRPASMFIKPDGTLLHSPIHNFIQVTRYGNGLAAVKKYENDKYSYYINKDGQKAFDREFVEANAFEDGLAWVSDGNHKFYCIDTSGQSAFDDKDFTVDGYIEDFIDGVAEVYVGKERVFIDRRGRKIF